MTNNEIKRILDEAKGTVEKTVEEMRKRRNEEDRRFIVANIGEDLVRILTPFLQRIADNSKLNRDEFKKVLEEIKVITPEINVPAPQVTVKAPEIPVIQVPEIEFPKEELIRAIKQAFKEVRFPKTEVNVPAIEMPKEIKVAQMSALMEAIQTLVNTKLKLDFGQINPDNPLPVILTDEKGHFYRAMASLISGGGGSPRIIEISSLPTNSLIGTGRKTVTTGGTREALAGSSVCKKVILTAETDNTGIIVVGGKDVVAALATRQGIPLYAGDHMTIEVDNLSKINLDTTVNTDGVTFIYFN